jgi:hypothetical protein
MGKSLYITLWAIICLHTTVQAGGNKVQSISGLKISEGRIEVLDNLAKAMEAEILKIDGMEGKVELIRVAVQESIVDYFVIKKEKLDAFTDKEFREHFEHIREPIFESLQRLKPEDILTAEQRAKITRDIKSDFSRLRSLITTSLRESAFVFLDTGYNQTLAQIAKVLSSSEAKKRFIEDTTRSLIENRLLEEFDRNCNWMLSRHRSLFTMAKYRYQGRLLPDDLQALKSSLSRILTGNFLTLHVLYSLSRHLVVSRFGTPLQFKGRFHDSGEFSQLTACELKKELGEPFPSCTNYSQFPPLHPTPVAQKEAPLHERYRMPLWAWNDRTTGYFESYVNGQIPLGDKLKAEILVDLWKDWRKHTKAGAVPVQDGTVAAKKKKALFGLISEAHAAFLKLIDYSGVDPGVQGSDTKAFKDAYDKLRDTQINRDMILAWNDVLDYLLSELADSEQLRDRRIPHRQERLNSRIWFDIAKKYKLSQKPTSS